MQTRPHGRLLILRLTAATRHGNAGDSPSLSAAALLGLLAVCPLYAEVSVTWPQDAAPAWFAATGQLPEPRPRSVTTIPAGTRLEVMLNRRLSSGTDNVGDPFSVRLADSVRMDGETVLAEGTRLRGRIVDAARDRSRPKLTLVLDTLLIDLAGAAVSIQTDRLTSRLNLAKYLLLIATVAAGYGAATVICRGFDKRREGIQATQRISNRSGSVRRTSSLCSPPATGISSSTVEPVLHDVAAMDRPSGDSLGAKSDARPGAHARTFSGCDM